MQALLYDLPGNRGKIFGLYKIIGRKNKSREQIAITINEHIERFALNAGEDMNMARRFEQLLQTLNEQLNEIANDVRPIPITDMNAIIGVISDNQVYVSGVGELLAHFMHKSAQSRFTVYELNEQFDHEANTDWHKLFLTILDGELNPGDIFYVATAIPNRELSQDELQHILVTLPPSGALQRIGQYRGTQESYGAVLFKMTQRKSHEGIKKVNPLSSIQQLTQTKEQTADLLGDQKMNLNTFMQTIVNPLLDRISGPGNKGTKSMIVQFIRFIIKVLIIALAALWSGIRALTKLTINGIKHLIKNRENRDIKAGMASVFSRAKESASSISNRTKIVTSVALLVILSGFILTQAFTKSRKHRSEIETFNSIVKTVEDKRDSASANLIYEDKEGARQLIAEALALLDTVAIPKSEQQTVEDLKIELNELLQSLQGIEHIALQTLAENGSELAFLAHLDSSIYGVSNSNLYYLYDSVNNSWSQIDAVIGSIGSPTHVANDETSTYIIDDNSQLGRFNAQTGSVNPIISGVNRLSSLGGIESYVDNLYAFSTTSQQITKMQPQGDGFDAGTPWISARETDISEGRDIAIDGDIYILLPKGIAKFSSGREVDFNLDIVDPLPSNMTRLFTNTESNYLYVLESDNNRILVFTKTGDFVRQYSHEQLGSAHDIYVDEETKTIFFITDQSLHSFTASHLLE